MANQGAAASYYNEPGMNPSQPPPNYENKDGVSYGPPLPTQTDGKQTFDQAFKLEKPKYNDLWAGILVCFNVLCPLRKAAF